MGRPKTGKNFNCLQCGKEYYVRKAKFDVSKFCSLSCGTTYRNLIDNPAKKEEVRKKISENHADVSGEKNPMYGRRGSKSPSYKHGYSLKVNRQAPRMPLYRIKAEMNMLKICHLCGNTERLEVHHKDGNNKNNDLDNLIWLCKLCHLKEGHTWERDELGRFISATVNLIKE